MWLTCLTDLELWSVKDVPSMHSKPGLPTKEAIKPWFESSEPDLIFSEKENKMELSRQITGQI